MNYKYDNIEISRVAIGTHSNENAPCEYWHPSEFEPDLPDGAKLKEMLSYAKRKLVGRAVCIQLAVIYHADGVPGKQLNERASVETGNSETALEALLQHVLTACVEDAKAATV